MSKKQTTPNDRGGRYIAIDHIPRRPPEKDFWVVGIWGEEDHGGVDTCYFSKRFADEESAKAYARDLEARGEYPVDPHLLPHGTSGATDKPPETAPAEKSNTDRPSNERKDITVDGRSLITPTGPMQMNIRMRNGRTVSCRYPCWIELEPFQYPYSGGGESYTDISFAERGNGGWKHTMLSKSELEQIQNWAKTVIRHRKTIFGALTTWLDIRNATLKDMLGALLTEYRAVEEAAIAKSKNKNRR